MVNSDGTEYDTALLNVDQRGWWDRHIVPRIIGFGCSQPPIMKARMEVVPRAKGDILELGCGGGMNIPLYDIARISSYSGIDPSAKLLEDTKKQAQLAGLSESSIHQGIGEAMPFADDSFDTIVVTYTLCSVTDPAMVQREMRRVLRPGGHVLFLEHGRAPDPAVAKWQKRLDPIWSRIAGNCHLSRPVADGYRDQGFVVSAVGGRYIEKAPKMAGWIEWGEARPA